MLKSTLLLATALFLISAPAPDSADIAEATHGLIADTGVAPLNAAMPPADCATDRLQPNETATLRLPESAEHCPAAHEEP